MRKIMLMALAASMAFAMSAPVKAQETRGLDKIFTECGIGGLIFQKAKYGWAAALSNVIWDLGTTATTSALTTPESCYGGKTETAALIYKTYSSLENDIAIGSGEHLAALAAVGNCDAAGVEGVRAGFAAMVADESYVSNDREANTVSLLQVVEGSCDLT